MPTMIVEFDIDSDVLSHTVQTVPGTSIVVDHLSASDSIPLRNLFWASGGDTEQFEQALASDPTIEEFERLLDEGDARLYRVQYTEDAPEVAAYRAAVELDGTVLHAENDSDGWVVRMRFPGREAIAAFCERCWEAGFDLNIRAVYDQTGEAPEARFGLTTAQYNTLLVALEMDYFAIPRRASLEDVATELGVSSQAASERLRRGMKTLVKGTIGNGDTVRREPVDATE